MENEKNLNENPAFQELPDESLDAVAGGGDGDFYRDDLIRNGVHPLLFTSPDLMSGCSIVLITPDGERTFATYLGAAAELTPDDISAEAFSGFDIFHIEGFETTLLFKTVLPSAIVSSRFSVPNGKILFQNITITAIIAPSWIR